MANLNPYLKYLSRIQPTQYASVSAAVFERESGVAKEDLSKIYSAISIKEIYDIFITQTYTPDPRIIDAIVEPLKRQDDCSALEKRWERELSVIFSEAFLDAYHVPLLIPFLKRIPNYFYPYLKRIPQDHVSKFLSMLDKKFSPSFPTDMQTECRVVDREGIRTTQTAISLLISDLLGKETWLSAGYFHTECVFEPLELRSRLVSALEALRDVGKLDQFTQNPLVLDDLSQKPFARTDQWRGYIRFERARHRSMRRHIERLISLGIAEEKLKKLVSIYDNSNVDFVAGTVNLASKYHQQYEYNWLPRFLKGSLRSSEPFDYADDQRFSDEQTLAIYELGLGITKSWINEDKHGCYFSNRESRRETAIAKSIMARNYANFREELIKVISGMS